MPVKITSVEKKSPAARAGILPGDILLRLNGHEIQDVLDYRFYETSRRLAVEIERRGKTAELLIHKGEYDAIGLEFATYLMDRQRSCANQCVFCFIDQLPSGLRDSLYFKDDDARLSFLFGNYITLTNLSEREISRIITMHISPVNISVHTTNPELRARMMGNRFAGKALGALYRFAEAGLKINCQLVLCPGLNDGAELERTLRDLGGLWPSVQSVAAVPVGLTRHREGLYPLSEFDKGGAQRVVQAVERHAERLLQEKGARVFYAADEFYIKAERPIPPAAFYGDFDQLENGVGMIACLRQEFEDALQDFAPVLQRRRVSLATGTAAAPFLRQLLDELNEKCHNLTYNVIPIVNHFFGETITVAGLVTGGDLIGQLADADLGDALLIPSVMLRHEGDLFLDGVSLTDLKEAVQTPIITVPNDGHALLCAVTGSETNG